MHLVLLAFKSSWRPRKECFMTLKLVWSLINTVSKEGPDVYRMVSAFQSLGISDDMKESLNRLVIGVATMAADNFRK